MSGQTPPGWYPDPYGTPGLQRWFDGTQWTQSTQPAGQPTPAPWSPPEQGPGTPQPWQAHGQGGTPQPWTPPATPGSVPPPRKGNQAVLLGLAGGGAVVVVLVIVAVLLATGAFDSDDPGPNPTRSTAFQPPNDNRSPVVGTITDSSSGLSWSQLGGEWTSSTIPTDNPYAKLGLVKGQVASVHKEYNGPGTDYVASAYSAELPTSVFYTNGDLEPAAKSWFGLVRPAFYPEHRTEDVSSRAYSVGGKKAWYYEARVSFPQAESKGWNFRTERAVIILVDRPGDQPAGLFLSFPDSHANQGDLALILGSLKIG
ncbi:DUF2510 domain-containing protein [Actinocorallia populi]|uniref:DUF2510 domain-containing protein n=1 Tax=Actinocorallia populi TaxID=2079200 RepID=UPI000D093DF0|nr:DUF2510 domain-containing protein [Actinocorallia populi]